VAWEVAGTHIAAGGTYDELFYRPTVLTNLGTDNPAWSEQIFGPVAPVMSFTAVDEAATVANASNGGLSVGILGEVGPGLRDRLPIRRGSRELRGVHRDAVAHG
jgi:benzaldehyde dehydrogenase (NAD)